MSEKPPPLCVSIGGGSRSPKVLASILAISSMTLCVTGVSANADEITASDFAVIDGVDSDISPASTKYSTISFNLTSGSNSSKTGTFTATDSSAKVTYYSCSTGQAYLYISVNGEEKGPYVIPETNGQSVTQNISCSKGDTIKYTVAIYSGYSKAIGSFTVWY
ncbi:MAG: hypothetical protein LUG94_00530 [Ruminococcus sp.]|nr:hypothetical protein [Ruminococcus sp.]